MRRIRVKIEADIVYRIENGYSEIDSNRFCRCMVEVDSDEHPLGRQHAHFGNVHSSLTLVQSLISLIVC
jgi:hypothetical protein